MECGHHLPLVISRHKHSHAPSPACHRTPLSWRAPKSLQVEGLVRRPPSHLCLPKSRAEGVGWPSVPPTEPHSASVRPHGGRARGALTRPPLPHAPLPPRRRPVAGVSAVPRSAWEGARPSPRPFPAYPLPAEGEKKKKKRSPPLKAATKWPGPRAQLAPSALQPGRRRRPR